MYSALSMGSRLAMVFVMLGGASLLGACAFATEEEVAAEESENGASTQQAIASYWTSYTSEERGPISCSLGHLVSKFECTGSYCDNISAYCRHTDFTVGVQYWSEYFSEEWQNKHDGYCGYKDGDVGWVTGFACQGSYCDNVSIQCSTMKKPGKKITPINCKYTVKVSEEYNAPFAFPTGYFAIGAECDGSFCDSMSFYICQMEVTDLY